MAPMYMFDGDTELKLGRRPGDDTAIAFDLDGPLANIFRASPLSDATTSVRVALRSLAQLARIVVITSSPTREVEAALGFQPHLVISSNPQGSADFGTLKLRERLYELLGHEQGIDIELEGEWVAVHYASPRALSLVEAAIAGLHPQPRTKTGRCLVKLAPAGPAGKGAAVAAALQELGCKKALLFQEEWQGGEIEDLVALCDLSTQDLLRTLQRLLTILAP